ncbi:MAG: hypothetical protein JXR73_21670, partial [Candidatus Omnitrophica bacterium]|nr:hypothetical protein [Candidatus Omnitrophota bacterium]
ALGEIPIRKAPGGEFPRLAGELWTGLSDFSAEIRNMAGKNEYDAPPGFNRKYADLPVTTLQRPFHSNRYFTMAAAVPSVMTLNQPSYLISQTRIAGSIAIELYSKDGKQRISVIRHHENQKDPAAPLIFPWTPNDLAKDDYRIRWTLDGDYREFPITIQG